MEKISIPVFYLERKGMRGYASLDEFVNNVTEREIYVVDLPSFKGRDINLKYLSKISNIYDVWYESNVRWIDDIYDILLSGAKIVVLGSKKVNENFLKSTIKYTENIALKSDDENLIKIFFNIGGKMFITSINLDLPRKFNFLNGRLVEL
ncbi:MAG: HisA/HisF-related TIM barrel protein [Thermoplasmata archaeon]